MIKIMLMEVRALCESLSQNIPYAIDHKDNYIKFKIFKQIDKIKRISDHES